MKQYKKPLTTCEQIDIRYSVMAGSPPSILGGTADESQQLGKERDTDGWEEF